VSPLQGNAASIVSHDLHQLACAVSDSWELINTAHNMEICKEELTEAVRRIRGTANQLAAAMRNTQQYIRRELGSRQLNEVQQAFEEALSRYQVPINKRPPKGRQLDRGIKGEDAAGAEARAVPGMRQHSPINSGMSDDCSLP
jgi:hypothetical protein